MKSVENTVCFLVLKSGVSLRTELAGVDAGEGDADRNLRFRHAHFCSIFVLKKGEL